MRRRRAETAARRSSLAAEKKQREADLSRERETPAGPAARCLHDRPRGAVEAAAEPEGPGARRPHVRLLRVLWPGARASRFIRSRTTCRSLAQLDAQLESEDDKLAELEKAQRAQLDGPRGGARSTAASCWRVWRQSRTHAPRASSACAAQQAGLEKLLKELRRALEKFPSDRTTRSRELRGKLAWPVSGRVDGTLR